MPLSSAQKRSFKAKANTLKPVVTLGDKGLTENLLAEAQAQIEHHELIKVKLAGVGREHRQEMTDQLCAQLTAEPVAIIGQVAIIYRRRLEPK